MKGVIEGRIVHYIMPDGEHRPAIIVNAWGAGGGETGSVNMQVFVDGSNDIGAGSGYPYPTREQREQAGRGLMWRTNIVFSADVTIRNTWHWPEKT